MFVIDVLGRAVTSHTAQTCWSGGCCSLGIAMAGRWPAHAPVSSLTCFTITVHGSGLQHDIMSCCGAEPGLGI
jgi:hypothetical protein